MLWKMLSDRNTVMWQMIFFKLWTKDDLTDDEYDMMAVGKYSDAYETYWDEMEKLAGTIEGAIDNLNQKIYTFDEYNEYLDGVEK